MFQHTAWYNICYGRMIFGPVPFFDIHHIQNRSISCWSCWHFQKLQEKSTVAQRFPNPTWNIFGPQINTPNSSKPRSAGEGATDGTTHKVHQTARRLGLSRDHVKRHISSHVSTWLHGIHCQQRTLDNFRNTYPASFSLSLFIRSHFQLFLIAVNSL